MRKLTIEAYLPLALSGLAIAGVTPFAVIRFLDGDWLMAVLDTLIVIGFTLLGASLLRPRRVRLASVAIAVFCILAVLTTVYLKGITQIYWAYPALLAVFYLMKPNEALTIAIAAILVLLPALLPGGDPIVLTAIFITLIATSAFAYAFAFLTREQRERLLQLARKDPLTGVGNRRALDEKLDEVCALQARHRKPSSMLLIDIDNFKAINDEFGHATGDQILVRLAEIIALRIRGCDSLYRIGGEEFVIVAEGQRKEKARRLAEQLRTLVEAHELVKEGAVTISLGVAELSPGETPEQWMHRADVALYESKRSGRNQTSLAITGRLRGTDLGRAAQ